MQTTQTATTMEQTQYVFAASEPEHERLVRMAGVMDPYVSDTLTRLELAPGSRVIEFGCGPLGALLPLSAAVGPDGAVVGLDRSGEALDKARSVLAARDVRNVHLLQADLTTLTPGEVYPSGPFDLAFCHFVLCYQTDVAAALRRMASVVRPGGYIVAQELVFTAPIPLGAPGHFVPAANHLINEWFLTLLATLGTSWDVPQRYSVVCQEAGLVEADQRIFAPSLLPAHVPTGISIYHAILTGLRPLLLRHDIAPETAIDRVLGELQAAQEEAHTETIFTHIQAELVARVA